MNLKASDIYGEWYFKVEKVVVVGECVLRGVCVGWGGGVGGGGGGGGGGGQGPTCWKS